MSENEAGSDPRRARPPGRRHFVLACGLLGLMLVVAAAFPFAWRALRGGGGPGSGSVLGTVLGGTAGAAGAGVWTNGVPGFPGTTPATVEKVQWGTGDSLTERWATRVPGQGTVFGYYVSPGSPQGYTWADGMAVPIEGETERVLLVEWPRGEELGSTREMRLSIARVYRQDNGDMTPLSVWGGACCMLDVKRAAWVAENGVPEGLVAALLEQEAKGVRVGSVDAGEFVPGE